MARSQDSLQERLRRAYTYNLIHLRPENVPADEEGTLAEIKRRLTSVPAKGGEGTIAATTAVMSEDDARALIEKIVGLYGRAAEALGKQRASRSTG